MQDALEGVLLRSRRSRAFLVSRLHGWTFMIALGLVATALVLLSDGDVIAGSSVTIAAFVAVWVGGVWAWPWGVDRYVRRVRGVMHVGFREASDLSSAGRASLHKLRVMIEESKPPSGCIDVHRGIVEQLREMDSLEAGDRGDSLADRAVRMTAVKNDLRSALERLSACHADFEDREDRQLARLVERLLRGIVDTHRAPEIPVREMSERLRKMHVPQGLRDKHGQCEAAVSAYLTVLRRFNETQELDDIEAIREAAHEFTTGQAVMKRLATEYIDELRAIYSGNVLRPIRPEEVRVECERKQ
jgi:hypothetical protein